MIQLIDHRWEKFMGDALQLLLQAEPQSFNGLKAKIISETPGLYLITIRDRGKEVPLYVGRTKGLRGRIYSNHLMGGLSTARLKNYLINDQTIAFISDKHQAKDHMKAYCLVRWIAEDDYIKTIPKKHSRHPYQIRGLLESYFVSKLFPRYGIYEEH